MRASDGNLISVNLRGCKNLNLLRFVNQEKLVNLPKKQISNQWTYGWMDGLMDRKRARWMDGWMEKHTLLESWLTT